MTNSQSKADRESYITTILDQLLFHTKLIYLGDIEIKKDGESYMFYAYDVEGDAENETVPTPVIKSSIDLEFNHTSVAYVPDAELGTHWVGYNCADDPNEGRLCLFKAILFHNLAKANMAESFPLVISKIEDFQRAFWKK